VAGNVITYRSLGEDLTEYYHAAENGCARFSPVRLPRRLGRFAAAKVGWKLGICRVIAANAGVALLPLSFKSSSGVCQTSRSSDTRVNAAQYYLGHPDAAEREIPSNNITTHGELVATLTGTISVLALIPAAIGLYGVMSYNMLRMTIEMLF